MTTALDRILAYKSDDVRALKAQRSVSDLLADAKAQASTRGFCAGLDAVAASGENALICEIKRKSPSAGDILPGAVASEIARDYEKGGAACLSVLTDGPSFGGSLSDFEAIRNSVQLPMLRKDFMIDPYQIIESRAHGADCILIILSAVDDACARDLQNSHRPSTPFSHLPPTYMGTVWACRGWPPYGLPATTHPPSHSLTPIGRWL